MIEIKKEKLIYNCLNMVYINYLLCLHLSWTVYLPLKILKLLGTNYKPGQREHQGTQISESELISKG